MGGKQDIFEVIGKIYDASAGLVSLEDVMVDVCDLLDSAEMLVYEFDPITGDTPYTAATPGFRSILADYSGHYVRDDPRVRHAASHPELTFLCDYDHISEAEMDRSEHYAWLRRDAGVRYYMGWREHLGDGLQWGAAVQRTPQQGHAQREQTDLFKIITPHLVRANNMRRQLTDAAQLKRGFVEALDGLGRGVLVVDGTGAVRFANLAARRIAETADGFGFANAGITITIARNNVRFRKALADAFIGGGDGLPTGRSLTVTRPSGKRPFFMQISPFSGRDESLGEPGPLALVMIADPETRPPVRADRLREIFGLTPAEARLAIELASGDSMERIADKLNVKRETARSTLKQVYVKTDTHRQAELVRLLLSLP